MSAWLEAGAEVDIVALARRSLSLPCSSLLDLRSLDQRGPER